MNDEMGLPIVVIERHLVTIGTGQIWDWGHAIDDGDFRTHYRGECTTCLWVGEWRMDEKAARAVAQRHADQIPEPEKGDGRWLFVTAMMALSGIGGILLGHFG